MSLFDKTASQNYVYYLSFFNGFAGPNIDSSLVNFFTVNPYQVPKYQNYCFFKYSPKKVNIFGLKDFRLIFDGTLSKGSLIKMPYKVDLGRLTKE